MKSLISRLLVLALLPAAAGLLSSCETISRPTTGGGTRGLDPTDPVLIGRNAQIRAEQPASYYIGRRYWIEGTRFWGFVRRPGQMWDDAPLSIMNESQKHQPDRLPEKNSNGNSHGYDHDYEYKLTGRFTGQKVYDPNSNLVLPEFQLQDYELISKNPGFLFHPRQKFEKLRIPKPPNYN
ncbi:MAG: hypothetical protein ACI8UO_000342 [Verrucomicrobiales bacterium]|jgi:hypothetical protein